MDAPCKIQGSIHVFRLVNNMCPGKWVHIIGTAVVAYTKALRLRPKGFTVCIIILCFCQLFVYV